MKRAVTLVLLAAIHSYRLLVSPMVWPACRYHPSCSAYAEEAIQVHGPSRGGLLAIRRPEGKYYGNGQCEGGFDPVPPGEES